MYRRKVLVIHTPGASPLARVIPQGPCRVVTMGQHLEEAEEAGLQAFRTVTGMVDGRSDRAYDGPSAPCQPQCPLTVTEEGGRVVVVGLPVPPQVGHPVRIVQINASGEVVEGPHVRAGLCLRDRNRPLF